MEAKLFRVTGRVQGVGFRFFVERVAQEAGLSGWVRNRSDRSVEVYAEGAAKKMDALRAALSAGPPGSRVERVEEQPAAPRHCRGFSIETTD